MVDQLKIREYTDDSNKFYVYFQKLNQTLLIAIPDQFWSVEISNDLSIDEINETLLMQFLHLMMKMKQKILLIK